MLNPPEKRSKIQFNLRTDPELMEWLKIQSEKYERPVNYIINYAIKQLKKEQGV